MINFWNYQNYTCNIVVTQCCYTAVKSFRKEKRNAKFYFTFTCYFHDKRSQDRKSAGKNVKYAHVALLLSHFGNHKNRSLLGTAVFGPYVSSSILYCPRKTLIFFGWTFLREFRVLRRRLIVRHCPKMSFYIRRGSGKSRFRF